VRPGPSEERARAPAGCQNPRMVGRASTAVLRVLYAAFALLWVALAIRSAHQGDRQAAIAYAVVAVAWLVVVVSIVLRPSRWGR
jgi:hypothetical protein